MHDRQLYDRLSSMSDPLDRLIAALNAGEGTAGPLLRNRHLYDNMNSAVTELRDLISNISQGPRKYLTVRGQFVLRTPDRRRPMGFWGRAVECAEETMANREGSGANVLLAFLAGAAVGAAVALLFAPASGQQTREYLSERAREGRERAAEAARQGREALKRQRETVTTAFERAREQYRSGQAGDEQA